MLGGCLRLIFLIVSGILLFGVIALLAAGVIYILIPAPLDTVVKTLLFIAGCIFLAYLLAKVFGVG